MKIAFIGTVEFSKKALKKLIELKANIVGVVTKREAGLNADFADLADICAQNNIAYRYSRDINSEENIKWLKGLTPDVIFCFGWPQLLKKEILNIAPMGVVGFHPAKLPEHRGRHPIIWALVLGIEKTTSTFFFIEKGIDSGDILSQTEIDITYEDNARSLYDKVTNQALKQIEDFLPQLSNKTYVRIPQDDGKAGFWRKRERKDGEIDFRKSSRTVYNLVRGLTKPYVGAHVLYKNNEVKIWKAKEVRSRRKNSECGKVLDVNAGGVLVECRGGRILLTKHEFRKLPKIGEYLTS